MVVVMIKLGDAYVNMLCRGADKGLGFKSVSEYY